ncbi:MAG TPA: hypothetical protein VMV49_01295 [Candidatus Deferrimicrobium sp.]|nr:hypothetical protein [Candidatus Deferrimicrobium sp.]
MAWIAYYPLLGILFIITGIIIGIWFIIHVDRGFRFSGLKSVIAIILLSIFFAFGIQFILISLGALG